MNCRRWAGYFLVVMGAAWLGGETAEAGGLAALFGKKADASEQSQAAALVPLEQIPPSYREKVSHVLARPTLYARGPSETFECRPELYRWFLDHPDRTVVAWRRLGAKCVEIENRGNGWFGWGDTQGSDIAWTAVHAGPNLQIWFAEGKVKPGTLFPLVPVQCVVILRHGVQREDKDGALMQHQADLFAFTDSKAATLVTRMLGPSVPRMAKEGVGQLQTFFGAMAWYCAQHPDRAEVLLRPETKSNSAKKLETPFDPTGMIYPEGFSGAAEAPKK